MSKGHVWVVDDDHAIRWVMEKALLSANIKCKTFSNAESVLLALEKEFPDLLISDIRMPGIDGINLLNQIHSLNSSLPVIIMTAHSDLDAAVNAYQQGAFEYLPKPFNIDDTIALVKRALIHSQKQHNNRLKQKAETNPVPEIIGEAPSMQEVFRAIGRLSHSSISVLINGESGTGKDLVAQALHKYSPRSNQPFIALNMAAIPKELIESELFGHEKGAFTGASTIRQGRFEQANKGTLFLDEIGDMPLDIQTRLLRVLSDGQFYRVGGHSAIKVDVRIIAATHQNLEKQVNQGLFREDLFHRLNVIRIQIPALRDRQQDIKQLSEHFLRLVAKELGVSIKTLHHETVTIFNQYQWPGNVRQLENTCRWLTVMTTGNEILPDDLPPELSKKTEQYAHNLPTEPNNSWQLSLENWAKSALLSGEQNLLSYAQPEFERILLKAALQYTHGHKQDAAKVLGWGRNTLTRKIKELY